MTRDSVAYPLEGKRILVLDDDHPILETTQQFLSLIKAIPVAFHHPPTAIEWLKTHHEACDAVLTDIHMPDMDGYQVTHLIRNYIGLLHLPIIAVTGEDLHDQSPEIVSAGFSGLIRKPFDPDALVELIRSHV